MYSVLVAAANSDMQARIGRYVPNISPDIEVAAAEDEDSAIAKIREGGVNVVVYEHGGPRDAFAFFDKMLRGPGEGLPFILLSHHKDADLAIRAMDVRMDYYLPEDTPNFFSELASRIKLSAERHHSAEQRETEMQRSETIVGMMSIRGSPVDEILARAIEGAVKLTKSEYGYIAIFNHSTKKIKMMAWSMGAMAECRTDRKLRVYDLDKTGIWGEPLRNMRPVVVNDYASEPPSRRKGVPPGHIRLERLMMIPATVNGVPVGTAGVANKATDYTDEDVETFKRYISNFFTFYQKDIDEDAMRITEGRMIGLIDSIPIGIATLNEDGSFIQANQSAVNYLLGPDGSLLNRSLDEVEGEGIDLIRGLIGRIGPGETTKAGYFRRSRTDIYTTVTALSKEGQPSGWLVSMTNVSLIFRSAGSHRPARNTIRHFATYTGYALSAMDDDIEEVLKTTGEGEERETLEGIHKQFGDLVKYFRTESAIAQRPPVWRKLSDCVPKPPKGFRLDMKAAGYSILADPVFPSVFDLMYTTCLVHGSDSAEVSAAEDGNGGLTLFFRTEGYTATGFVTTIMGSTSDGLSSIMARDIAEASGFGFEVSVGGGVMEARISVPSESFSRE